ncbi:TetR/AcrR family transcriptional regulator [Leptothoe spongobia TAU-MAC 1115]|uniref:TetR/AcrR family transcriptional regulator n=2 Tax=Leptothoe TaxID=2651725 RepID=A0A947DHK7_9CYAN|nr:TetR/AcrR family transcriptional regulator [Leptothoe spongobia TAU-MAC 1115]
MPKEDYVPTLFSLFRQYGYDGTTLSKISAATGLGKASLYHHFPGGKEDMVASVLDHSDCWLQANVLHLLAGEGSPQARLQKMCEHIHELYAGGTQPCLTAILAMGTGRDLFHDKVKGLLESWIGAIANVLVESGFDKDLAIKRGQDALISIQGALIVAQNLDNASLFQRTIQQLPQVLLHPEEGSEHKQ